MRKQHLLNFAEFLENEITEEQFRFDVVILEKGCGTVGCAIGWLPLFDGRVGYTAHNELTFRGLTSFNFIASSVFYIPEDEAYDLFSPGSQDDIHGWGDFPVCEHDATPKDVAAAIRHYVEIRS